MGNAAATAVRVLVVDDSPVFREAARELLETIAGFRWIGDAVCGEDGVQQAARLTPDLVLMDVRMPGIGGVEAARRIARQAAPPTVVLITGADLGSALSGSVSAPVLGKQRLCAASLTQLWQDHGSRPVQRDA